MDKKTKIHILSGWSNPGGSTVAHIELCKLFNSNGLDCTFYGPHDWHLDKCKSGKIDKFKCDPDDTVIVHFLQLQNKLPCKQMIYSCHETNIMPITQISQHIYDYIHFVSMSQYRWHNAMPITKHMIIPNVVNPLKKSPLGTKKAAVIGSIDKHKQTHISIQRALDAGYKNVLLYGNITDQNYYMGSVQPYVTSGKAVHVGHVDDKQKMYDSVDEVFHSSLRETYNLVKAECYYTGVKYNGLDSTKTDGELWTPEDVFKKWKSVIG